MIDTIPANHRQPWERWEESELTRLYIAGSSFTRIAKKLKRTESAIRSRWSVVKSCGNICGMCNIEVESQENSTVLSKRLAQVFGTFINNSLLEKDKNMGIVYKTTSPNKFTLEVCPIVNKKTGESYVSFTGLIPLDYNSITNNTVKQTRGQI